MKSKRSKSCDIPKKVKDIVWERDSHVCVVCGTPTAMPNCHYISRAKGGLGIPENIVTACMRCHFDYDNGDREYIGWIIKNYLMAQYPEWNEENLRYRKGQEWTKT